MELAKKNYFRKNNKYLDAIDFFCTLAPQFWRDARVVEEARLESVCTPKGYHGFESHSLRNLILSDN